MQDTAKTSSLVGQVLGDTYKVEKKIGSGGMGDVYLASHLRVPRKFAIKILNAEALTHPEVFARFRREAEIASSLGHDNITQVFDFNQTPDGKPFMVLEFLEGEELHERIQREGRLGLAETARLLEQIASGLEAAHASGIVHRDLKPRNLFLCKRKSGGDRIKILDFGISKIVTSASMATVTGSIMGTPSYMSPEQADGRVGEIDARTDVFALGSIVFECLCGSRAFEGPSMMGTLYQIVQGEPADLSALAPELPQGVRDAVAHALVKDISRRTQSPMALLDEFLAACPPEIQGQSSGGFTPAPPSGSWQPAYAAPPSTLPAAAPMSGTPAVGMPVGGTPADGMPVGGTPVSGMSVGGMPVGGMSVGGMSVGGVPVGGMPVGVAQVAMAPQPYEQPSMAQPEPKKTRLIRLLVGVLLVGAVGGSVAAWLAGSSSEEEKAPSQVGAPAQEAPDKEEPPADKGTSAEAPAAVSTEDITKNPVDPKPTPTAIVPVLDAGPAQAQQAVAPDAQTDQASNPGGSVEADAKKNSKKNSKKKKRKKRKKADWDPLSER